MRVCVCGKPYDTAAKNREMVEVANRRKDDVYTDLATVLFPEGHLC